MEKEIEELKNTVEELQKQISDKDVKIQDMETHSKNKSYDFKRLRDMTDQQRELMTEQEMQIKKEQDMLLDKVEAFELDQKNFQEKGKNERIDILALKYAKGNKEIADQIKIRFSEFKSADLATLESEIEPLMQDATRIVVPNFDVSTVGDAHNQRGGTMSNPKEGDYSTTQDGSQVYTNLFGAEEEPKS